MKGLLLSLVGAVFFFCLSVSAQGNMTVCAIPDYTWRLYEVPATSFSVPDAIAAEVEVNLCKDIEKTCAHTGNQPCTACQWINKGQSTQHSYCIAYSQGVTYARLNSTKYYGQTGFQAQLLGDNCGGSPRKTFIDVLCNQPQTRLGFISESPTCTYNFNLTIVGNCDVKDSSFAPTFTVQSVTPTSISLTIDDGYPWEYWTFDVKLNGVLAYSGDSRHVTLRNLKTATKYDIVVYRVSGDGAVYPVTSPSATQTVTTLPQEVSSNLGVELTGKGAGIAIGFVLVAGILAAGFAIYKYVLPKFFGGGSNTVPNRQGYLIHEADQSNDFE